MYSNSGVCVCMCVSVSVYLGYEDDDLVELESVQQVVELAVLLGLVQAHEVLLQSVQGQLGVVVDEDLHRVLGWVEG